jgi:hypothetical protein
MTKSLRPQQHRRDAAVTSKAANPAVPGESHGLGRRVFGRDGETGRRQRLTQVGRNVRGRWRGEHDRHVVRLVHFRCDDGCPRNRELPDRPIEVTECGKRDTVGRDRGLPSRKCDRWRWTGIARGARAATTHEETAKNAHGGRETSALADRSCSRNADARCLRAANWTCSRNASARSSRVPPHALQSSVRPACRSRSDNSSPVAPPSSPATLAMPGRGLL